jgi:hypothetical protein
LGEKRSIFLISSKLIKNYLLSYLDNPVAPLVSLPQYIFQIGSELDYTQEYERKVSSYVLKNSFGI